MSTTRAAARSAERPLAELRSLFVELNDLKRIRSAGRDGSIAARRFREAWAALVAGASPDRTMLEVTAATLAAARLGDLDARMLGDLALSDGETLTVLQSGFDAVADPIESGLLSRLREALGREPTDASHPVPDFVIALERQPRAGVTCPGRPRIVLEPPENHAEHCLVVAVYGAVLSPVYGADPATVFLAGLAHHLHNAAMPDAGFTGEMLLGDTLAGVVQRAGEAALGQLAPPLRAAVEAARRCLPDAETAEGRAFHAADVLDRVLQIEQHLRPAELSMAFVLDDMQLVHAGPVKPFHDGVLAEAGLA